MAVYRCVSTPTERRRYRATALHQSLVHHRVSYFEEAGNVRAIHIIPWRAVLLRGAMTDFVNRFHDVEEPAIHFLARPGDAHAVLSHFQSRRCDSAGVSCFARTEKNPSFQKLV